MTEERLSSCSAFSSSLRNTSFSCPRRGQTDGDKVSRVRARSPVAPSESQSIYHPSLLLLPSLLVLGGLQPVSDPVELFGELVFSVLRLKPTFHFRGKFKMVIIILASLFRGLYGWLNYSPATSAPNLSQELYLLSQRTGQSPKSKTAGRFSYHAH